MQSLSRRNKRSLSLFSLGFVLTFLSLLVFCGEVYADVQSRLLDESLAMRVAERTIPEVQRLGFYPLRNDFGRTSVHGGFRYKSREKEVQTGEFPRMKWTDDRGWVPKGEQIERKATTATIAITFYRTAETPTFREKPEEEIKSPSSWLEKDRFGRMVKKVKWVEFVRRTSVKTKTYLGISGKMKVIYDKGQTSTRTIKLGRTMALEKAVNINQAQLIGANFVYKIDRARPFYARINARSISPLLPAVDEATVDRIMEIIARILLEELGGPAPPESESEVGTQEPELGDEDGEAGEEELEGHPPLISLELLNEPDGLITPADEITLRLVVENRSQKDILAVRVIARVVKDIGLYKAVTFLPGNDTGLVDKTWDQVIKPGMIQPISEPFKVQIADEENQWIKNNLITKGGGNYVAGNGKPDPELNVKEIFRAKVEVSFVPGRFERIRYKPILIMNNEKQVVPLAYPDLKHLTGIAPSGGPNWKDQSEYHKTGDIYWSHLTSADIRKVAIRAATYTETKIIEDGELIDVNIEYKAFPDDIHTVVMNVVHFVHRTFYPKIAGNPAKPDTTLAEWILSGKIAPENWIEQENRGEHPFVCVSHSLFLGSLLRALGVPVREVFVFEYFYGVKPAQDAASEVWYDGKWHFFALFDDYAPMTNSQEYLKNVPYYDVWVGVGAYPGQGKSRFNMWARELNASPYWRYIGLGDKSGFHPGPWLSQHWVYTIFSPVTAVLTLPGGRRIGASNPIDPKAYQPFKTGQSINTSGIINEIEHAYYYPEGVEVYPISEDPSSVQIMKQAFILPAQSADERNDHTIMLMGTGSGGYKVTGSFIDGEGKVRDLESFQGDIREGEKVVIRGSDLQPQAVAVPARVPTEENYKVDERAVGVPGEGKERDEFESPDNDLIQDPDKHKYRDQKGWESLGRSDSAIPSRHSPDEPLRDSGRLEKPAQPYQKGGWETIKPERKDFEPDSSKRRDSLGF